MKNVKFLPKTGFIDYCRVEATFPETDLLILKPRTDSEDRKRASMANMRSKIKGSMAFGGFKKNFQRSESDKADPFNMPVADAGSDEMQMYQKKITKKKFRYFVRCGFC